VAPQVSIVTGPPAAGVQRYQTEAPPGFPAWWYSADSFVAPTFVPATPTGSVAPSTWASASLSLAGRSTDLIVRATDPSGLAPPYESALPSTAIRYVVPAVAAKVTLLPAAAAPQPLSLLAT
jgi:hypothetical protein